MPSNSVTNSEPEDTFATIVEGGKVYGDRIAAWVKAKSEHDAAYAKLQLGRATKNMLEEAQAARDAATKTIADAHTKADEIVAAAMTKANSLVQHGEDRAKAAMAAAEEANRQARDASVSAQRYAADSRVEADKKYAEASMQAAYATNHARDLAAAKKAADKAKADADAAKAEFLRKHQEAQDFHKRLWG